MDTAPHTPEPACDPPDGGFCPHCGAGGAGIDNPAKRHAEMLTELAEMGMDLARMLHRSAQVTGRTDGILLSLEMVGRFVRRTLALHKKVYEDSCKTPAQRAAEEAQREADAAAARLRDRSGEVRRRGEGDDGPSDRENLLSDMNERLLGPAFQGRATREMANAFIQQQCQRAGIAPKDELWSEALLAAEIKAQREQMRERAAAAAAPVAEQDSGWRAAAAEGSKVDGDRKIGRFTFGPDGSVVAEDPPDRPQADWPPDVLGGRDLPDLLKKTRDPPDSG
jgi:hypothetical protein